MVKSELDIGIAGAGIAGLVAGTELQRAGYNVSIFEAGTCIGGRIQSIKVGGLIVETGPEFIHGHLRETLGLLKKYDIDYEVIDGKMYSAWNGKLEETYGMTKGWDLLLNKMKSLEYDQPLNEFLENNFQGNQFNELKKFATRFAEGFDLADTNDASTMALYSEWQHEESDQYRIPTGYGSLIAAIEKEFKTQGGKILLNHSIAKVDWNYDAVQIETTDHRVFKIDKLIISLPISLLNQREPSSESIIFHPGLEKKKAAFQNIGFGTVVKIVMIWESTFWKTLAPDAQFIFSDCFFPTWWTQNPMDIPMLSGWLGGPKAELYADKADAFFLDNALESLAYMFSLKKEVIKRNLKEFRIFNWKNKPWIRGAYSYARVGSQEARAICREPVQQRIYFTGEAYYEGPFPGTVEAAVVSGQETVRQILADIKNTGMRS
jgi:monoamine oxidase